MIRFCDKEVYCIQYGETVNRLQMLQFFLQSEENRCAVIAVYGERNTFKGIITYEDLLNYERLEDCINKDTITVSEDFWKTAKDYFAQGVRNLLPVINENGGLLGFAYNDDTNYFELESGLAALEKGDFFMPERFRHVQMAVIMDLNELAWRCYKIFLKKGFSVCVIGEAWEWFGLKSGDGYTDYPDYAKMYLFAEGTGVVRGGQHRFGETRNESVMRNFDFIFSIVKVNEEYSYADKIKRLISNGAAVCECCVPDITELNRRTEEELRSIRLGVSFADYLDRENDFTDEMKNCLWSIYGREKSAAIKEKGNKNKLKNIPLGTISGWTLKEGGYKSRIYLIGPCIAGGSGCLEEDSLLGRIQAIADPYHYQAVSIPIAMSRFDVWQALLDDLPVRRKDIILIINVSYWFPDESRECGYVDLKPVYEEKKRRTMFCGVPIHTNQEGNRAVAEEISRRYLNEKMKELALYETNDYIQEGELLNPEGVHAVREYTNRIRVNEAGTIGAIVMNCNPFTYGHRHLIEYASGKVDKLYIFVVEEDQSFFKFEDRLEMVKQGTRDIPNVIAAPSGNWVLSYKTMPAYFQKETIQEIKIDAKYDLEIFARYIAPQLGISIRFVGEEPFDRITGQYNEQMKEILPLFGIKLEEIPRYRVGGETVSASIVRKYLREGKTDELKKFVPESTYAIINNYCGKE